LETLRWIGSMRREEFGFVIVKTAEPYLSDSMLSPLSQST